MPRSQLVAPWYAGFDKAGFWIWGLFEEPQYPFLTFNLEVKQDIKLAEGVIPAGQIFGQASGPLESPVELHGCY